MSGFLYYRPGPGLVNINDARRLGLGYAFDGGTPSGANGQFGPDDLTGTIFGDRRRFGEQTICYAPNIQTWRKLPRADDQTPVWVGWYTDHPPTPTDLERPSLLVSADLKLADGNVWKIPIVRRFHEAMGFTDNLPRTIDQDEAGKWIYGAIVQKHIPLWEAVGRFLENLCGAIVQGTETTDGECEAEYTVSDELDAVALLLAANYVLGPTEIAALGLLVDDGMILDILKTAADWQTFVDWAESKKNATDPSMPSTEAGQPAG